MYKSLIKCSPESLDDNNLYLKRYIRQHIFHNTAAIWQKDVVYLW